MYTPVSTAEVHEEHKKAKAAALKLTPRKRFCKVAPELSVGCVSTSAYSLPSRQECRESNLRPPGATARRYRQKKSLEEDDVGKQVKIYLFVEVQQIISGIHHLSDIYPYYYWGR